MQQLCRDLIDRVPEIVSEWQTMMADRPWLPRTGESRVNGLPAALRELLNVSLCAPGDPEAEWRHVLAAAAHGHSRRVQGSPDALLFSEYHVIREAVRRVAERLARPESVDQVMARLDMALTVATTAALRGFHREELETMGRWPGVLRDILRGAPHTGGRAAAGA